MQIKVIIKNVYGKELIYPACNNSRAFALLAKTKTLSTHDLQTIKTLGFEIIVESPVLTLKGV